MQLFEEALSLAFFIMGFNCVFIMCAVIFTLVGNVRNSRTKFFSLQFLPQNSAQSQGQLISYGGGTLVQLFLPCYFATEIQATNDEFMQDLMATDWIETEMSYKKMILFTMQNMKTSHNIKVLKIFNLNIDTYLKVCE